MLFLGSLFCLLLTARYSQMYTSGRVPGWCMPYLAKDVGGGGPACSDVCSLGPDYSVKASSLGVIQDNVRQIQSEILSNGPVFAAFWVYTDFMAYTGGVYSASKEALAQGKTGGHAVMMVGWGTDKETGQDYWLLQNSWSEKWGDKGRFKIKRGVDECGIESLG